MAEPAPKNSEPKKSYAKRPLWQWLVIYLIVAAIVYAIIYLLFIHKSGTTPGGGVGY